MPTVRKEPRAQSEAHSLFYKHFERVQVGDIMSVAWIVLLMNKMKSVRRLLHLRRINYPRFKIMARFVLKYQSSLMLSTMMLSSTLHEEALREKSYSIFPSDPDWRSKPRLDSTSYIWSEPRGEETFEFR